MKTISDPRTQAVVIGAGLGRTGTMSLKLALERLGYGACFHMVELLRRPERLPVRARAHARRRGERRATDATTRRTKDQTLPHAA